MIYLKEPANGLFVLSSHRHHIFIEPEEWSVFFGSRFGVSENTEKLKEETTSTL